jgi:hypothetical protein
VIYITDVSQLGGWKQIQTAPLDRDLELAVIDTTGTHLVAFPCRRLADDRWVDVAVAKEGVEITRVTDPGAVFGEISALLDQPHSADVRALTSSQFHVADAAALRPSSAFLCFGNPGAASQRR